MNFVSTRVVTGDVARLIAFYEQITGIPAQSFTPEFAEITTGKATLAIAGASTVPGFVRPDEKILEFLVDDVDAIEAEPVMPPTTMPWGNRSMLVRDPDGTLVNLFTPVTPEAKRKFGL
ncbi:glyoxalase [Actinoplanes cyaneus]|uniref:Glyoxalase n=1 Tax=Actinoplanes cyaneus TaxID=52696 RepID=A0A919IR50_9ACTN|nr:VOC family protein [Actinoplanes cyaneus]MCW2143674.1 putative conserved protein PhnB, glyoxalase superfamily [Actinoplanes cyaneus]GID69691.1 glyoxalase [Actinoplanes cyaneus]